MKKNFLKKLSFVMASAMLISAIAPAAGANAATSPALNSTKKVLHLSGISGKSEYDFNVKNKQSGWKYAWTSTDKNVATVDNVGLTTATGVGTTKVSVKISKSGKTYKTLSATVTVRDNIDEIEVKNAPEKELKVNEAYNLDVKYTTESGSNTKKTGSIKWTVDKADKATVAANGVFKATEAGDYKVTVSAYETSTSTEVLASNDVTIKVAPSLTDMKQVNFTKVKLTFDTDMSKVITKDNLKAYRVIGGVSQPVELLVKGVSFDTTGKELTAEMYVDFVGGETYKFVYGKLENTFVAAKADVDQVTSVVLDTKEIPYVDGAKALAVKLYNADGVDITTTALTSRVTYALTNNVGYLNNGSLTLFAKGDKAVVKATFHTYKYDANYSEIVVEASGEVIAVDKATYTIGSSVQWTLSKTAPDWSKSLVTTIAAGDTGYSVWSRIRSTDTSAEKYFYSYAGQDTFDGKITFSSSNSDVLIVDTYGTIYPAKAGSAVIICYYDNKAIATFPVEVKDARAAAQFTLDKQSVTLSNSPAVAATADITLTIKDQLGADFNAAADKISFTPLLSNPVAGNGPLSWVDASHMKLRVTASGVTEGTYTYQVKAYDKVVILVVTIQKPTLKTTDANYLDDVIYFQLSLDKTSVDTAVSADGAVKSITPTLIGYASNGVAVYKSTWLDGFTYTVSKDNTSAAVTGQVLTDGTIEVAAVNGTFTSPVKAATTGSAIAALENGTYIVTAKDANDVVKGSASFVVTNTKATPAYVLEKSEANNATLSTVLAVVRDCVKVTLSGSDIADDELYSVEYVVNGTTSTDSDNDDLAVDGNLYVKSVKFVKTFTKDGVTYAVEYKVDINRTIVIK